MDAQQKTDRWPKEKWNISPTCYQQISKVNSASWDVRDGSLGSYGSPLVTVTCCPHAHRKEAVHSQIGAVLKGSSTREMRRLPRATHSHSFICANEQPGLTQAALRKAVFATEPFKGRSHLKLPSPPSLLVKIRLKKATIHQPLICISSQKPGLSSPPYFFF